MADLFKAKAEKKLVPRSHLRFDAKQLGIVDAGLGTMTTNYGFGR